MILWYDPQLGKDSHLKLHRHLLLTSMALVGASLALAADPHDNPYPARGACSALPTYTALKDALKSAQALVNGGFKLNMWGTIVNRDGVVCAVAFTGSGRGDQWPGSRVISAQKANTANAFSLPGLALSTANLYSATQPGEVYSVCNTAIRSIRMSRTAATHRNMASPMTRWSAEKSAASMYSAVDSLFMTQIGTFSAR